MSTEMSRPRVVLSAAATLDGKIATRSGDSGISSTRDMARMHKMRAGADAILVGKNTMLRDDPLLTVRYAKGPNPVRVVLDPAGEIPSGSRIMRTCGEVPTIIAVSSRISRANQERLEGSAAEVIKAEGWVIPLRWLLEVLAGRGIRTVLVEGGGTTNWEFVREGLVDEVVLTVSPRMVGGTGGTTLVDGEGFARMAEALPMRLVSATRQGDEVVLHYERVTDGARAGRDGAPETA